MWLLVVIGTLLSQITSKACNWSTMHCTRVGLTPELMCTDNAMPQDLHTQMGCTCSANVLKMDWRLASVCQQGIVPSQVSSQLHVMGCCLVGWLLSSSVQHWLVSCCRGNDCLLLSTEASAAAVVQGGYCVLCSWCTTVSVFYRCGCCTGFQAFSMEAS